VTGATCSIELTNSIFEEELLLNGKKHCIFETPLHTFGSGEASTIVMSLKTPW
jgi:hypothetical protein